MNKYLTLTFSGVLLFILVACDGAVGETEVDIPHIENADKNLIEEPTKGQTETREYYRDTLTVYLPTEGGDQFFDLDFNRRESADQTSYLHYYYLTYFDGEETHSDTIQFSSPNSEPNPEGFLLDWENNLFEDLSTRENYSLSVEVEGERFDIVLEDLQGDFITKNRPEYTRYTSPGKATVTKNGENFEAYAVLEKAYSSDDSVYVYFDGYRDLSSQTQSMHLWDEEGDYYYLDKTEVFNDPKNYTSHTWLLHKNVEENTTQKAFSATVDFSEAEKKWALDLPDFGVQMDLTTEASLENSKSQPASGPVSGTLTTEEGEIKQVRGWFGYYSL